MDAIEAVFRAIGEYIWFVLLAMIGGTINYVSRVRRNAAHKFSVVELLGEWVVSGFVGVLTIYLGLAFNWPMPLIGFACGISGHMAGRIVYMLDNRASAWVEKLVDRWLR